MDLKDLEPLSKFKHNPRMHQAVCQNCRMPQAHRNMMHKALQAPFKPIKVKKGTQFRSNRWEPSTTSKV